MNGPNSLSIELMSEAREHLLQADPVMSQLVKKHIPCNIHARRFLPFHSLATSIISQQLSAKASDTIERRVSAIIGTPFTPVAWLEAPVDPLRAAGLSGAKERYIRGLASRVLSGNLQLGKLRRANDETAIASLVEVPGIGKWTAEMFLIFSLKRPDVLSLGDAGLQRAARLLYGNVAGDSTLEKVSSAWIPYRSVASWYLWRHLDTPS
jgi:DNA-3-methyladenine glycosylase II